MLTIKTSNQGFYDWMLGEESPSKNPAFQFANIYQVEANGRELEYLKTDFSGIPIAKYKSTNVWDGDLAKFIAKNL